MMGFVGWMNSEIRFGQVEDEPALADVVVSKTELVPNESAYFLDIRCVEEAMHSFDQLQIPNKNSSYITISLTLFIFSSR